MTMIQLTPMRFTHNVSPGMVHVLLEVHLEVLEDKRQRLLRVNDVVQRDNVHLPWGWKRWDRVRRVLSHTYTCISNPIFSKEPNDFCSP